MSTATKINLSYSRRADGWWITGLPDPTAPEAGPYDSRREAQEDSDGMRRTIASAAYQRALAAERSEVLTAESTDDADEGSEEVHREGAKTAKGKA